MEIIAYTDPYCTWCWGSEPITGKIKEVYQDQVKIRYVMGGLVKDISDFSDPANGICFEVSDDKAINFLNDLVGKDILTKNSFGNGRLY